MKCPYCGVDDQSRVVDSRPKDYGVFRRKECLSCGRRFNTVELCVPKKWKTQNYVQKLIEKDV